MLFKVAVAVLSFLPIFSTATQTVSYGPPKPTPGPISQCNTGDAQCCNSATSVTDPAAAAVLGLLGVVVQGVDVLVGLQLLSVNPLFSGVGEGANCAQQPVCSENNNFNGLINIGCTPIFL
ncbi:hypothetical protein M422DRAFT_258534 [Sphaerobolus stellatus SS14]|uniref:Hydrophobin n=1 Tax=Sphaerobolus stellatus (strain SS14) TaxID=990650 RepID=A0A0C9UUW9_SPHS4|nr:hypothetical protein M422DRAFT_258534 [Sphaerobolus stellatus SS14]